MFWQEHLDSTRETARHLHFYISPVNKAGSLFRYHPVSICPLLLGKINDRALNLGENRWKFSLQAGYVRGLTENLSLDLAADVTLYGENSDFGPEGADLDQDPLYQLQGFLRYNLTPTWDIRGGLSYELGGETKIDGQRQSDEIDTLSGTLGTAFFINPTLQLVADYGRDLSVDNGLKEDHRVNLRLMKVY